LRSPRRVKLMAGLMLGACLLLTGRSECQSGPPHVVAGSVVGRIIGNTDAPGSRSELPRTDASGNATWRIETDPIGWKRRVTIRLQFHLANGDSILLVVRGPDTLPLPEGTMQTFGIDRDGQWKGSGYVAGYIRRVRDGLPDIYSFGWDGDSVSVTSNRDGQYTGVLSILGVGPILDSQRKMTGHWHFLGFEGEFVAAPRAR
jgi:hypothetical protein